MKHFLLATSRAVGLASIMIGIGSSINLGNTLGIATIQINEGVNGTIITAADGSKRIVARLDLVHGRFIPTEYPELRGREVEGRKLFVEVNGKIVTWETIGFSDTTRMPALPGHLSQIAAFLAEPRVRKILEKWRIGWAPGPAYVARASSLQLLSNLQVLGSNPRDITGLFVAGFVRNKPINTCGNIFPPPIRGWITTSESEDAEFVSQCCPDGPDGQFFGIKACGRTTGDTVCGDSGANACIRCPGSPQSYSSFCSISLSATGNSDAIGAPLFLVEGSIDAVLGPVDVWVGLKNSDDIGIKFDLMAEAYKNGTLAASGSLTSVPGGSSGFNNARLRSIPLTAQPGITFSSGDTLAISVSVRNACSGSGKNSGRARLWYNDTSADSGLPSMDFYLRTGSMLIGSHGPGPRQTIDLQAGAKCSPFKSFGSWTYSIP